MKRQEKKKSKKDLKKKINRLNSVYTYRKSGASEKKIEKLKDEIFLFYFVGCVFLVAQ